MDHPSSIVTIATKDVGKGITDEDNDDNNDDDDDDDNDDDDGVDFLLVVLLSWNDWNLYYLESFHDGGKSIKERTRIANYDEKLWRIICNNKLDLSCIFETSLERIVFSTWLFSGKQANLYEGSIKSSIECIDIARVSDCTQLDTDRIQNIKNYKPLYVRERSHRYA
ncbi:hypothetical protein V1477_001270 [Vespula maculifrons]|uniref:Uncharacterized protein n=1 Tax=Vespula maculifrons TaxID=7453 RepID=A0ABD2CZD8_VESMC